MGNVWTWLAVRPTTLAYAAHRSSSYAVASYVGVPRARTFARYFSQSSAMASILRVENSVGSLGVTTPVWSPFSTTEIYRRDRENPRNPYLDSGAKGDRTRNSVRC